MKKKLLSKANWFRGSSSKGEQKLKVTTGGTNKNRKEHREVTDDSGTWNGALGGVVLPHGDGD